MKIEIDKNSGFCFGVVYAIEKAEYELQKKDKLFCLGDIVHNTEEVERLEKKGLETIDFETYKTLKDTKVLIRAHGAPPEIYKIAMENNIELVDASCPVVLRLQNDIKRKSNPETQIVIFGKKGHAEVNGLVGQTNSKAIVITDLEDIEQIDFNKAVQMFSQTTKSPEKYNFLAKKIQERIEISTHGTAHEKLKVNQTSCNQVSRRDIQIRQFAFEHDIIIFVSGEKSSNGKMLYEVSKKVNRNTYFISNTSELKKEWFLNMNDNVGICGATSTPMWLMQNVKEKIQSFIAR